MELDELVCDDSMVWLARVIYHLEDTLGHSRSLAVRASLGPKSYLS